MQGEYLLEGAGVLGREGCYLINSFFRILNKRYRLISYKFSGIWWRVVASHAVTAWNLGVDRPLPHAPVAAKWRCIEA